MNLTTREQRAVRALLNNPIARENLDAIAGCSNGPELVASLRRKGLNVPCERVARYDRDGRTCYPGVYRFSGEDKALARDWLSSKEKAAVEKFENEAAAY